MKQRLGILAIFAAVVLITLATINAARAGASAKPADKPAPEAAADDGSTALTIYNQNFFVAREHVALDLQT